MSDLEFELDGVAVAVPDDDATLLDVLRERLGVRSAKDGCAPQGQCGCCTVLVDGSPRVACVTPVRRVRHRAVTTLEGLDDEVAGAWAAAMCNTGGSQCGFCTPGIILRLEGLRRRDLDEVTHGDVRRSLLAHLCRCTGWQTIVEAVDRYGEALDERDWERASARATLEGRAAQSVGPSIPAGRAPFAADTAPPDALVAMRSADGTWHLADDVATARALAGKVQGRRSSAGLRWPIEVPIRAWDAELATTWVEPAYLETDASWCAPGGEPATPLANGGAFGAKLTSEAPAVARRLADESGRAVRVLYAREDVVRLGPKRPPLAGGARRDGSGEIHVARTPGIAEAIAAIAPRFDITEVDVVGPPTTAGARGAGWAEAAALLAAARWVEPVHSPEGAIAEAHVTDDVVRVHVECGDPLDEVVLRSYCIGAAHMALGMVWSEGIAVDPAGEVHDLTIRSFGVLRAEDMPQVEVTVEPSTAPPVNGSDAVFAAVLAAAHVAAGSPERWPCRRGEHR